MAHRNDTRNCIGILLLLAMALAPVAAIASAYPCRNMALAMMGGDVPTGPCFMSTTDCPSMAQCQIGAGCAAPCFASGMVQVAAEPATLGAAAFSTPLRRFGTSFALEPPTPPPRA